MDENEVGKTFSEKGFPRFFCYFTILLSTLQTCSAIR